MISVVMVRRIYRMKEFRYPGGCFCSFDSKAMIKHRMIITTCIGNR
jgi:hypothetical protein